ncbi:hypothetical protein SNEBB_001194 [Seison nebaliae]|nr:hypothetical protein SNEBB_001194 [Seison nebaliae]
MSDTLGIMLQSKLYNELNYGLLEFPSSVCHRFRVMLKQPFFFDSNGERIGQCIDSFLSRFKLDYMIQLIVDFFYASLSYAKLENIEKSRQTEIIIHRFMYLIYLLLVNLYNYYSIERKQSIPLPFNEYKKEDYEDISLFLLNIPFPFEIKSCVGDWPLFYYRLHIILLNTMEIFVSKGTDYKNIIHHNILDEILKRKVKKTDVFYEKRNERILLTLMLLNQLVNNEEHAFVELIEKLNLIDEYVKYLRRIITVLQNGELNSHLKEDQLYLNPYIITISYRILFGFKLPVFKTYRGKYDLRPWKVDVNEISKMSLNGQIDKQKEFIKKKLDLYFKTDLLIHNSEIHNQRLFLDDVLRDVIKYYIKQSNDYKIIYPNVVPPIYFITVALLHDIRDVYPFYMICELDEWLTRKHRCTKSEFWKYINFTYEAIKKMNIAYELGMQKSSL